MGYCSSSWKGMAENHRQVRVLFNCHDPEQIQEYTELGILGIGRIHRNNSTEVEKWLMLCAI